MFQIIKSLVQKNHKPELFEYFNYSWTVPSFHVSDNRNESVFAELRSSSNILYYTGPGPERSIQDRWMIVTNADEKEVLTVDGLLLITGIDYKEMRNGDVLEVKKKMYWEQE